MQLRHSGGLTDARRHGGEWPQQHNVHRTMGMSSWAHRRMWACSALWHTSRPAKPANRCPVEDTITDPSSGGDLLVMRDTATCTCWPEHVCSLLHMRVHTCVHTHVHAQAGSPAVGFTYPETTVLCPSWRLLLQRTVI